MAHIRGEANKSRKKIVEAINRLLEVPSIAEEYTKVIDREEATKAKK